MHQTILNSIIDINVEQAIQIYAFMGKGTIGKNVWGKASRVVTPREL